MCSYLDGKDGATMIEEEEIEVDDADEAEEMEPRLDVVIRSHVLDISAGVVCMLALVIQISVQSMVNKRQ